MKHKTFGAWLKAKLKENNVQQKELAYQIAVSKNTVTSWTTNAREPSIRNFKWICRFIAIIENKTDADILYEALEYF
tara:strand:+ start:921 stop:1151 length:231 start_codon:yes stop_codon:yes gene_type:complete